MRSSLVNKYSVIGLLWASVTLLAQAQPGAHGGPHQDLRDQFAERHAQHQRRAGRRGAFRTKFAEPKEKELQAKQAEITDLNDKLQRGVNTMSQTAQDDMKKSIDRKTTDISAPWRITSSTTTKSSASCWTIFPRRCRR